MKKFENFNIWIFILGYIVTWVILMIIIGIIV